MTTPRAPRRDPRFLPITDWMPTADLARIVASDSPPDLGSTSGESSEVGSPTEFTDLTEGADAWQRFEVKHRE